MNNRNLTIAVIIFGLFLAALLSRRGDLAFMTLPFLAYLGAGIFGSPTAEKVRLRAARSLNILHADGTATIQVTATVANEGLERAPVQLSDPLKPGMEITEGKLQQWAILEPGEETQLKYTFRADRGGYNWDTLSVVVSDLFGLFGRELALPAEAEIHIQPKLRKFRPFRLRPNSTLHAPGSIPARFGGSGTDFWGVREYHPGDPLSRLDWRLVARHPNQFFTKEFEQEEIADIGLILDARQNTNLYVGEDCLLEHTLNATASLAEMFLHQGNRVSLLIFGEKLVPVYPGYSKVQLNRILRCLANTKPGSSPSQYSLDYLPLRMFSSRALLIILSPLIPSDWFIFPRLRAHGNQGLLICPDPYDFAKKGFPEDRSTQLAIRTARIERRITLHKVAQLHVRVIDWQINQPLSPLVRNALSHVRGARA